MSRTGSPAVSDMVYRIPKKKNRPKITAENSKTNRNVDKNLMWSIWVYFLRGEVEFYCLCGHTAPSMDFKREIFTPVFISF